MDADEEMAIAEHNAMVAENKRLRTTIQHIKHLVCGDARPRWDVSVETTTTRGQIADICDAALGSTP